MNVRRQLASYLGWGFVVVLAALLVFNAVQTIRLMIDWYSPLPLLDYWRVPRYLSEYSAAHFSILWRQHNEHRIVFPELVYAADMLLLRGRLILPLVLSAACYVGIWCSLVWAVYSRENITSPLREIAVLFAGALMLWQGSAAVLATPFQLSFTMMQFAVCVSFALLAKLRETHDFLFLSGLICAAIAATYSSASGMIVWPVLIASALAVKIRRREILIIAACGALAVGVYFIGYHSSGNLRILTLFQHPFYLIGFVASYFSMPFGLEGAWVGMFALAAFGICVAAAVRKRLWGTRLGVVVFGNYFFMLASALMTAAGRMEPTDSLFTAAKAPRYVTVPMAAWGTLVITSIWLLSRSRLRPFTMPAAFVAGLLACIGCLRQHEFVSKAAQDFAELQIASLMLRNNLEDAPILLTIYPDASFVKFFLPQLKEKRLSLYAHGPDKWLGQSLQSLHPFALPVPGQITRVYPVEGGLEIYGWSDSPFLADEHAVLFVDQNGKIAGFGRRPSAGFPLGFGTWETPPALAFVGFAKLDDSIRSLTAYVWQRPDKTLHRMGAPIVIPNMTPAAKRGTPPLAGVTFEMNGSFRLNGQIVMAENGVAPAEPIFGSSGAGKTGGIRSSVFAAPPNHCLILPVLHGYSAYGQSAEGVDADTRQVVAATPMFDGRSLWERWRVVLPETVNHVQIVAKDAGDGDTQWLAISAPTGCP